MCQKCRTDAAMTLIVDDEAAQAQIDSELRKNFVEKEGITYVSLSLVSETMVSLVTSMLTTGDVQGVLLVKSANDILMAMHQRAEHLRTIDMLTSPVVIPDDEQN